MRRLLPAILALALTTTVVAQQAGPSPFNFRVKLDSSSEGGGTPTTPIPPGTPNTEDDSIVVTINGPMNGRVSQPFEMTSSAAGSGTKTWSLAPGSGALPNGLSLNGSNGSITGSTDVAGLSAVIITRATRTSDGRYGNSPPFRLNFLTQAQAATASYPGPFSAVVGTSYAGAATSSGLTAPVTWSVASGTLPDGLRVESASGAISGVPTTVQTRTGISLLARGANGVSAATNTFQIAVADAPSGQLALSMPSITTHVGQYVSRRAVAYGGTPALTTSHVSALPDGITASGPTVSGVPTATGTFTGLVATASDAGGATAQATYSITVLPAQPISISVASRTAPTGTPIQVIPAVANATPPSSYRKEAGEIPPGLSFDPNSGVISGTPTTAGTYAGIVVSVTDAIGRSASTAPFTLTITAPPALSASVQSATFKHGVLKSIPISVSGPKQGPYQYQLASGTLPLGVSVKGGGTIEGTASEVGHFGGLTVLVTSQDGTQATSNVFNINVPNTGTFEIVLPEEIYPGTVGQRYDTYFSVRGQGGTGPVTAPITWTLSSPYREFDPSNFNGLTVDSATGAITGVPTAPFDENVLTLQATDAAGRTATSSAFRLAAKHDFRLEWETGYGAPPARIKKNAYYSAYSNAAPESDSTFNSWIFRKRGTVNRTVRMVGDQIPGLNATRSSNAAILSGYASAVGSRTYALETTDPRGFTRRTPDHTTQFVDTSYIAEYNPVTMSECGGASGDNYLFGGTWTSVNGKAVWTGWTGTKYSTHSTPRPWPSPASFGQGFDFYVKVDNVGTSGGTISIRIDQHRQLEGKIQLANLLDPSDNGWLYVSQTNPGNMPDLGYGKRSIFGTYGGIYVSFGQSGTFWEHIVLKDWRTGVDVPYAVEVVVRPRDPPICGFIVH